MTEITTTIKNDKKTQLLHVFFPRNKVTDILIIKQADILAGFSPELRKEISEVFESSETALIFPMAETSEYDLYDASSCFCENNNIPLPDNDMFSIAYYDLEVNASESEYFKIVAENPDEIRTYISTQKLPLKSEDTLKDAWNMIPDNYKIYWETLSSNVIEKLLPEKRKKADLISFSIAYGFTLEMTEEILNLSGFCLNDSDYDKKAAEILKERKNFTKWLKKLSANENASEDAYYEIAEIWQDSGLMPQKVSKDI